MKYRDYLIVPALVMYLLYASCAYIANKGVDSEYTVENPTASISPAEITWGDESGDNWYAGGTRGSEYFTVTSGKINADKICFHNSQNRNDASECSYTVSDMHLKCSSNGQKYDLIFLDELTAYDCNSDTCYQRGDYSTLVNTLTCGRFVNENNERDYFVFKENGKSTEYFGNKVFKGKWSLETADCISVFDNECKQYFHFMIHFDYYGNISGIEFNSTVYNLVA